jgi:predicted DNA-binding transcriptional regulator AlpA
MPLTIDGTEFYTVSELAEELEVSRQTLWRWRTKGEVPQGRRYRNREVVFTESEAAEIRHYAYRLEPIDPAERDQLGLFNGTRRGGAA